MIRQTKEVFPNNKMYWKFFELNKFRQSDNYINITKDSPLKEQWLEFFIDCSKKQHEPDRNEIIKKGYDIMKVATWDNDVKTLYWKQKATAEDLYATQKEAIEEARIQEEGREEG